MYQPEFVSISIKITTPSTVFLWIVKGWILPRLVLLEYLAVLIKNGEKKHVRYREKMIGFGFLGPNLLNLSLNLG